MGGDIASEARQELWVAETRGSPGPGHQALGEQRSGPAAHLWGQNDVGKFVQIPFAIGGGTDVDVTHERVRAAADGVGPEGEELEAQSAQRLFEVVGEVVRDRLRSGLAEGDRQAVSEGRSSSRESRVESVRRGEDETNGSNVFTTPVASHPRERVCQDP